jgi:hypothetical protein
VPAFTSFLALLLASVLPRVEDPLPDRIGLGVPFAAAGAGGVLAGVIHTKSSPDRRDEAIRKGGLGGFVAGTVFYLFSFCVQVGFGS